MSIFQKKYFRQDSRGKIQKMSANKLFRTFLQNVKQTRNMSVRGKIYIDFLNINRKEFIINLINFQQIKGSTKMSML